MTKTVVIVVLVSIYILGCSSDKQSDSSSENWNPSVKEIRPILVKAAIESNQPKIVIDAVESMRMHIDKQSIEYSPSDIFVNIEERFWGFNVFKNSEHGATSLKRCDGKFFVKNKKWVANIECKNGL